VLRPGIRYLLLSTVFFAAMNTCVKFLPHIPAHEIIFFRCVISLGFSYIQLKAININPWGNNKAALILRGIFGMTSLTAFFITLQHMPLASAVTIQYLSPIFTIIFAGFILHEKTKPVQYIFFFSAFAGVVLVHGFDERIATGDLLLGLISAVFSGLAYNMIRKSRNTEHPLVVVFYFPLVALPFITIWCITDWVSPHGWDWLLLAVIGLSTQAAQVLMTRAYQLEKASSISGLQYFGLVYSLIIGYFIFNELYPAASLGGMLLIVVSILLNYFYEDRMNRKRKLRS
jgi:drug/metabolite transporter (DMT)-like permease